MYIYRKLSKKEDTEDLVQNVFVSFYKSIERFDENKPIKPYLFQIVINELKMYYRRYHPSLPLKEDIYLEKNIDSELDLSLIKSLKSKEKNMLQMIADGFSYSEISKKFKKPINTVKSIIRRARFKLKAKIKYEK